MSAGTMGAAGLNPAVIHARGVNVTIDGNEILRGIDLEVNPGEFLGILGHNGSGKSTLIRALMGLQRFTGEVSLFGTPLADFKERNRIGYLSQDINHTTGVPSSVMEVVLSGAVANHRWSGWPSKTERAHARELIESVGLGEHARRPISELSGGQRQRAHIARALVGHPDLVVMDEPTVGVAAESLDILAHILKTELDRGTAIVMVTHELGAVRELVNRTITLEAGLVCDTCIDVKDLHAPGLQEHHAEIHGDSHTDQPAHHAAELDVRPVVTEGPLQ